MITIEVPLSKATIDGDKGMITISLKDIDDAFKRAGIYMMPEWVSVKERLPEEDETVLVWADGQVGISRIFGEDVNTGGPEWTYTGLGGDPEYWMPLPGAPEGEEHDNEDDRG